SAFDAYLAEWLTQRKEYYERFKVGAHTVIPLNQMVERDMLFCKVAIGTLLVLAMTLMVVFCCMAQRALSTGGGGNPPPGPSIRTASPTTEAAFQEPSIRTASQTTEAAFQEPSIRTATQTTEAAFQGPPIPISTEGLPPSVF